MSDEIHGPDPGDAALAARLAAYADARLRPDPSATVRSRARLVARATDTIPVGGGTSVASRRRFGRRAMALLLAAALALVVAGGALAGSGPGGPTYGVRLWLEELSLPSEPAARAAAELDRLEDRLAEAKEAAAAGDAAAAEAALDAFADLLADTIAAAEADPGTDAFVAARLAKHLVVLEALRGRLPAAALDGITNAIEQSSKAIDRLEQGGPGKPSEPPGKPSEPPGKPSDAPGKPSEPPGKPSDAPGKPSEPPGKPSP